MKDEILARFSQEITHIKANEDFRNSTLRHPRWLGF